MPNVRLVHEIPKLSLRSKLVFAVIDYRGGTIPGLNAPAFMLLDVVAKLPGPNGKLLANIDALARKSKFLA